jgi:hypothetical protein
MRRSSGANTRPLIPKSLDNIAQTLRDNSALDDVLARQTDVEEDGGSAPTPWTTQAGWHVEPSTALFYLVSAMGLLATLFMQQVALKRLAAQGKQLDLMSSRWATMRPIYQVPRLAEHPGLDVIPPAPPVPAGGPRDGDDPADVPAPVVDGAGAAGSLANLSVPSGKGAVKRLTNFWKDPSPTNSASGGSSESTVDFFHDTDGS